MRKLYYLISLFKQSNCLILLLRYLNAVKPVCALPKNGYEIDSGI